MIVEEIANVGLLLVEAQAPEMARQVSARHRIADPAEPAQEAAAPVSQVVMADMLDDLPPDWIRRQDYYEGRVHTPGRHEEEGFYAAAEFALGSRFDRLA